MDTGELSRKTDKLLRVMGNEIATSQGEWQNTINPLSVFFIQTAPHFVNISASITLFLMANIGRGKEHLKQEFFKNCNKDLKKPQVTGKVLQELSFKTFSQLLIFQFY